MEGEPVVRRSRLSGHRCPFALDTPEGLVCSRLNLRCGEREQFSLPRFPETEEMRERPHRCLRNTNRQPKDFRILIVDDDSTIRELCLELLACAGISNCCVAVNGNQAMEIMDAKKHESLPFDLAISDVQMGTPSDSGFSLATYADARNHPAPFILMSGSNGIESFNTGNGQVTAFLKKPFIMQDFLDAVENAHKKSAANT